MIERPKRSVTRFFVPLIDVMILLFCIFLLMPFVSTDPNVEPEPKAKAKTAEPELPRDVKELQAELERTRREVERLKAEQASPADHVSVKVVTFSREKGGKKPGKFSYVHNDEKIDLESKAAADTLITIHRRESGKNAMLFLIVYPLDTPLDNPDLVKLAEWFGSIKYQFSPN